MGDPADCRSVIREEFENPPVEVPKVGWERVGGLSCTESYHHEVNIDEDCDELLDVDMEFGAGVEITLKALMSNLRCPQEDCTALHRKPVSTPFCLFAF